MSYVQKDILVPARPPKAALSGLLDDAFGAVTNIISGGTAAVLKLGAARFTMVSGIAKPNDQATLDLFKSLQRQLNRVASSKGFAVIGIDGAIGPGTKALAVQVQTAAALDRNAWNASSFASTLNPGIIDQLTTIAATDVTTPQSIAGNAVPLYANIKAYADQLDAPPTVASPTPTSPPTIVDPVTGVETQQGTAAGLLDGWNRLGTTAQLGILGGLAAAAILTMPKKKRRK